MAILDSFFQIPSFKHGMKWPWLSLAYFHLRFLLVGQTLPALLDEDLTKDGIEALSSRPFRKVSRQTSRQMPLCGTPEKPSPRRRSVSDRSSIRVEEIIPAARVAIQVGGLRLFKGAQGLLCGRHPGGPADRKLPMWASSSMGSQRAGERRASAEPTVIQLENINCCKTATKRDIPPSLGRMEQSFTCGCHKDSVEEGLSL